MNSGATAERVYDALKRQIGERVYRPGDRLDPATLAEGLASSVTPVRDALHMLTGEGLVETRVSDGFHLPQIDEPSLKDLYAWNAEVLSLAIRTWPRAGSNAAAPDDARANDNAEALFQHIAERSTNSEHLRAIQSLNARLHAARIVEDGVLVAIDSEIAALHTALRMESRHALRQMIVTYHRRRRLAAAEIVRRLYRAS